MCNATGLDFVRRNLNSRDITGKDVIEVGSCNVNGSPRELIVSLNPKSYLGVDISQGPGVDEICDISDLVSRYGLNSFDLVICCEVFEHIRDWRSALTNLKGILKEDGVLLLTTRSIGFPYHGYPDDFWRFEQTDIAKIFSDLVVEANEIDEESPGVFVKGIKKHDFQELDLSDYALFSIISNRRTKAVSEFDYIKVRLVESLKSLARKILPRKFIQNLKNAFGRA